MNEVKFKVVERILLGSYEGLIVETEKRSAFSMTAQAIVNQLLFVRSNSWGGMFRLCLQDGGGEFKKGADYTRSTFATMELQLHFLKCWPKLPVKHRLTNPIHELCVDANVRYPRPREDKARKLTCPIGEPDYSTLVKLGNYKYEYDVDNVTVYDETKKKEYTMLSESARRKHVAEITDGPQELLRDPKNVFDPTHVKLTGSIYRVSIPGQGDCALYFYYSLINIKTTVVQGDNPIDLSNIEERDRMVPLITVPQDPDLNRACEALGIYAQYVENNSESVAKVMEYVQMCKRKGARCSNLYVLNKEYDDVPLFKAIKTTTLKQRRAQFSERFKSLKKNWGLSMKSKPNPKSDSKGASKSSSKSSSD